MITIVTATFNAVKNRRERTFERCVRSVLALETSHEHLILDGGSKDGSVEFLRAITRGVTNAVFISEPDTGIYNAFNKGWRKARGEWVYYLGDDDYLIDPGALDAVVADASRTDAEMVLSPAERPGMRQCFRSWRDMRSLLTVTPYCHQGVLMRRSLIERLGGFDERFRISADYDLLLKAHFSNVKVRYDWRKYAFFNNEGVSANSPASRRDMVAVTAKHLGLNERQQEMLSRHRLLPLAKTVPLVLHPSPEVRLAARHAIKRWVAAHVGMLDDNGQPKALFRV